jgi:predicted protein tyrosine phosphatase
MNILFVCTSGKDRSPALLKHYSDKYPEHRFSCGGINRYFTELYDKHFITQEDITWANLIFCSERVHKDLLCQRFQNIPFIKTLGCGIFSEERKEQYFEKTDKIVPELIKQLNHTYPA